jgi:hypothetical protein
MPKFNSETAKKAGAKGKRGKSEKGQIWAEMGEWFANEGIESYQKLLMKQMRSSIPAVQMEGMKRYEALLEYFKPKLARTELTGKGGEAIKIDMSEWK